MTTRGITLVVAVVAALIGVAALWLWRPRLAESMPFTQKQASSPSTSAAPSWSIVTAMAEYPQLSFKKMSREEATKISTARLLKDHSADWKVALNFYGKVVDENNQPVAGATAHMEWNTIGGTSTAQTISDGEGLFSLTGQHGKVLGVRVEKGGYYTVEGGAGNVSFEYADPSVSWWYEPDPNNPVIFHLRIKGEGAKLIRKSLDVPLNPNHPQNQVNLLQGFVRPGGVLTITSDESKFLPGNQPFPWTFSLRMSEGGLVETTDQFPFMAPTNGYTPTINLDMTNTDPSVWQDGVGKTYYFYLPSTDTYGRITINKIVGVPVVTVNYCYNLTPGNRVLEPASK